MQNDDDTVLNRHQAAADTGYQLFFNESRIVEIPSEELQHDTQVLVLMAIGGSQESEGFEKHRGYDWRPFDLL